ncbi:MAG: branched-chain amino acid ABC transporter permease [Nitrososphaerota archaeon]|nr:branched-chain amino acid ABC transporter permease [Nitrososphaerota archaeon]MDG6924198.1 branched-chain amino acid ABC transporter permease [Nitrososphaerota archaeon]
MPKIDKRIIIVVVAIALALIGLSLSNQRTIILQLLSQSLLVGGLFALAASGLSLIFGVMKVINLAHGDVMIFGSYVSLGLLTLIGLNPFLSLAVVIPLFLGIGYVLQRSLIEPSMKTGDIGFPMLITFSLSYVIESGLAIFFTSDTQALRNPFSTAAYLVSGIRIPVLGLWIFVVAVLSVILLRTFLAKSFIGMAIRAVAQDREGAVIAGIPVAKVNAIAFGIGTLLAGVGGTLLGTAFTFNPYAGLNYTLGAFVAIVLGGIGSIEGALVGGVILGISQTFLAYYGLGGWTQPIVYLIFIVVIIVRPTGLLAKVRVF